MADDIEIDHDEGAGFYLRRADEQLGELLYRREGDRIIFEHTKVDESLRGQGRARQLLDHAIEWVRESDLTVGIECPYVRRQFDKDSSLHDVLPD